MRVAVVGAGVVGLSTVLALLERGVEVTCFEAVAPMSARSAGSSRIFRLAHGSPELVELAATARRAYARWSEQAGTELVSSAGAVIAGGDLDGWASAMAAAGAEYQLDDDAAGFGLPVRSLPGPVLHDPGGGVLDAAAVGEFLVARAGSTVVIDTVHRVEPLPAGARVWTGSGSAEFDVCVIAAGGGTHPLAAGAGLDTPTELHHHVRLTFPLADPELRPPCLIDRGQHWRPGFTTYQHLTAAGQWAVGAHFDPVETAWELGRERVAETSRRLTLEYLRENLDGVEDRVVDEVYCNITAGWGDGYGVQRSGAVLTLYGDNLFKLAPVLGELLADAVFSGATPSSLMVP